KEPARKLADAFGVPGADGQRRRPRPDGEVRVAHLRRDRATDLSARLEIPGELHGHSPKLVVQALTIGDVALECLLQRDRDPLDRHLERSRVDAARTIAQLATDLAAQHARELVVADRRELTDRLDAEAVQPFLRLRADTREQPDREGREERRLA